MELATHESNTHAKDGLRDGRLSEATASAHGAVDKMAATAGNAVRSVTPAIDHAADLGHQAVNKVESAVKPAEQWVTEKADTLKALPKNAAVGVRQFVVDHPWQSVSVAVVAGFLLGKWRS